jgi:hypothetical protein
MAVQKSGSASSPSHLRLVAAPPGVPAGRRAAGARARPRSEPGRMLTSCVAPLSTVRYGLNPGRNLEQIPKVAKPSQRKGRQSQKNILVRGVIREVSPPRPDPRGSSVRISLRGPSPRGPVPLSAPDACCVAPWLDRIAGERPREDCSQQTVAAAQQLGGRPGSVGQEAGGCRARLLDQPWSRPGTSGRRRHGWSRSRQGQVALRSASS